MPKSAPEGRSLADQVLLYVASRVGPWLDVLDPTNVPSVSVRDIVLHFAGEADSDWSPTEVRVALLDLADHGWVCPNGPMSSIEGFWGSSGDVALELRGLQAAREVEPKCGRPTRRVVLSTKKSGHVLRVRFATGNRDLDKQLNSRGTVLACFYVVAVERPTRQTPLVLSSPEVEMWFQNLAILGIGPRTGPGARIEVDPESLRKALGILQALLPLEQVRSNDDRRRDEWFLAGALPEIRLAPGGTRHFREWPTLARAVWSVMRDEAFGVVGWDELIYGESWQEAERKRKERRAARQRHVAVATQGEQTSGAKESIAKSASPVAETGTASE